MTSFARIHAALINPVIFTVFTCCLGIGSTSLTPSEAAVVQPAFHVPSPKGNVNNQSPKAADWLQPMPAAVPTEAEAKLARRFSEALNGRDTSQAATPADFKHRSAQATTRVWVCSAWEELVQGRGLGRNCEWR